MLKISYIKGKYLGNRYLPLVFGVCAACSKCRIRSQNQGKCFPKIKNVFPKPFFCFPKNIGCFPKNRVVSQILELFKQVLYHKKNNSKTIFSMATLKAIVKSKTRNGMYNVYIRITQNRQSAYVRTSWMVNDKGLSDDKKDIIDPFVIQQTSILIEKFYTMLNQVDASQW